MKANYQIQTLPTSGVRVTLEGSLVRILFDFQKSAPAGEETPADDLYDCESVDVTGRSYDAIVSAIVNDRYPLDSVQAVMANLQIAKDASSVLTDEKRDEYLQEYQAYQEWRAHAKEIANLVLAQIS